MNKHKYTPGPWIAWYRGDEVEADIRDKSGVLVCRCYWPDEHRNAQLIAAAPEMLQALELVKKWMLGGQPGPHSDSVVLDVIESAIKKAKGE